ncbi:hypothetical protein [Nocardia brevicatena]|nr:hypothetical protein [Nocardia brevicatena]
MTDHGHDGFEVPPGKLAGWGVDAVLLGQLVGAAMSAPRARRRY